MDTFHIQIAESVGQIDCSFGSTREYFRDYLTEAPADFRIVVSEADRLAEQQLLDREANREGLRRRKFTEPFLERNVIQRRFAEYLLGRNVLLLHGSTVAVDGEAYLFTARCGVGKSTHTCLWREVFGERAVMVNDDRAFLKTGNSPVRVFGSPWTGKHGLGNNISAPLAGICILERGKENRIRTLDAADAAPYLIEQICFTGTDATRVSRMLTALTASVPLWQMACNRDPEAARMAFAVMSESK